MASTGTTDPSPVESIYFAALGRQTPQERQRYLDEACGGDAELRRQVEDLLDAQPRVGRFLEAPAAGAGPGRAADLMPTLDRPGLGSAEGPGTPDGPYKLLQ